MPNFHLHWLVAWNALDEVSIDPQQGKGLFIETAGAERCVY